MSVIVGGWIISGCVMSSSGLCGGILLYVSILVFGEYWYWRGVIMGLLCGWMYIGYINDKDN